jgi:eukaryotic translation initiation factor 2-alpha kinase 4
MVAELWANDVSAELAIDARSPELLLAHYRDDKHCWIVIIKHDAASASGNKPDLKVKSLLRNQDTDIRSGDLLSYLRGEMRERDHADRSSTASGMLSPHASSSSSSSSSRPRLFSPTPSDGPGHHLLQPAAASGEGAAKANVQVLIAMHRSKKTNKWSVVESAQSRAHALLASYMGAPIAAVETKDETMDALRETRLGDPDSWRRVIQSVRVDDRQYLQDVHAMLDGYRREWKEAGASNEGRVCFVYNFRTGGIILYDLGL